MVPEKPRRTFKLSLALLVYSVAARVAPFTWRFRRSAYGYQLRDWYRKALILLNIK